MAGAAARPRRGTGLIGTSVALALREKGTEVWLSDADPATARLAADLGAGTVVPDLRDAKGIADVAVLAMPPAFVGRELAFAQECAVADVYTDVASVKVLPGRGRPATWAATWKPTFRGIRSPEGSGTARPRRRRTCSSAVPGRCARSPRPRRTPSTR